VSSKVIKVQKIPRKEANIDDLLASFCYHYPQYKFNEARQLPYKRLIQMLKIAEKEKARTLFVLCKGMALTNAKPKAMKDFLDDLRKVIDG
jgi:hypothetical protein